MQRVDTLAVALKGVGGYRAVVEGALVKATVLVVETAAMITLLRAVR